MDPVGRPAVFRPKKIQAMSSLLPHMNVVLNTFSIRVSDPVSEFSFLLLHQARHVLANVLVTMTFMRRAFQGFEVFL